MAPMAYAPHVRVSFGGAFVNDFAGPEIWSCNVNGNPTDGPWGGETFDLYLSEMASHLAAWFTSAGANNTSLASLAYVKANEIGPDGKYTDLGTTHVHDFPAGVFGNAASIHPQIISAAYSWRTAISRGPGARGRIYPPNPTWGAAGAMDIITSQQTALTVAAKALLTAIANASGTAALTPVIASKVNASLTPITGVRASSVLDVQRRRKDQLVPTYVAANWP